MSVRVYESGNYVYIVPTTGTYQVSGGKAQIELVERVKDSGIFTILHNGKTDSKISAINVDDVELSDGSGGWIAATPTSFKAFIEANTGKSNASGGGATLPTATITSSSTSTQSTGVENTHQVTADRQGTWFLLDDDSSGLAIDFFTGDIDGNNPAAGSYTLSIAFSGYDQSTAAQSLSLTIT